MTCSNDLRQQGLAYPRSCKECGLGPCKHLATMATPLASALADTFITCTSGDGKPYVQVRFQTLDAAHKFHGLLLDLAAKASS